MEDLLFQKCKVIQVLKEPGWISVFTAHCQAWWQYQPPSWPLLCAFFCFLHEVDEKDYRL